LMSPSRGVESAPPSFRQASIMTTPGGKVTI
jgi:hypothetical protein